MGLEKIFGFWSEKQKETGGWTVIYTVENSERIKEDLEKKIANIESLYKQAPSEWSKFYEWLFTLRAFAQNDFGRGTAVSRHKFINTAKQDFLNKIDDVIRQEGDSDQVYKKKLILVANYGQNIMTFVNHIIAEDISTNPSDPKSGLGLSIQDKANYEQNWNGNANTGNLECGVHFNVPSLSQGMDYVYKFVDEEFEKIPFSKIDINKSNPASKDLLTIDMCFTAKRDIKNEKLLLDCKVMINCNTSQLASCTKQVEQMTDLLISI